LVVLGGVEYRGATAHAAGVSVFSDHPAPGTSACDGPTPECVPETIVEATDGLDITIGIAD
jgi:hypothetical protein